jgi:predicted kinase
MRPVLVLVNGIPGSGKSTVARAWTEQRTTPLALALDIDVLRGMLGGWRTALLDAGLAARAMAVAAIGVHLSAGHDVLVPQYLHHAEFIGELERVAGSANASFLECALILDHRTAGERVRSRALNAASAARGVGHEGALDEPIERIHEDFERFLRGSPDVIRLGERGGDALLELGAAIAAVRAVSHDPRAG